ncbi:MAG: hypothetical protein HC833_10805 [Leptolyngbyaceae cyanobacterium RM1_406_9]|nr:hypothetical protein [Leptolyngbyaceae cyanobacterium RM1_406_9]
MHSVGSCSLSVNAGEPFTWFWLERAISSCTSRSNLPKHGQASQRGVAPGRWQPHSGGQLAKTLHTAVSYRATVRCNSLERVTLSPGLS